MVASILPLRLTGATVVKRGKPIVGPIDLELGQSGISMIMGPNGSGKTTLLKLMHGLEPPKTGEINWAVETEIAQQRQAFVFQTPVMLRRTALANIEYPLKLRRTNGSQAKQIARRWLARINLSEAGNRDAKMLSGGERQKLAIARALALKPDVLFLDEPTSNLDGQSTREIETLIAEAVSEGVRVVMTTHDVGQGKRLADEIVFVLRGLVHERADAVSFFKEQATAEARAFLAGDIIE